MATLKDGAREATDNWGAQLRKGALELAIIAQLWGSPLYGLEILHNLDNDGLPVAEGTLYPILNRLRSDGVLASEWKQEGTGNPRKYYALTAAGRARTEEMVAEWARFSNRMNRIIRNVKGTKEVESGRK